MKKLISLTAIGTLLLILSGCSKSDPQPTSSTITFSNNVYTPVTLTIGTQTTTVNAGQTFMMTGKPGASVNGSAVTFGATTSGTQIGGKISWPVSSTYPKSGNFTVNFDVDNTLFFLKVVNTSPYTITKVIANYGLVNQQTDANLSIPNDGKTYSIGYYYAYSNSNVRLESGNVYWSASSLSLSGASDQSFTFNAN